MALAYDLKRKPGHAHARSGRPQRCRGARGPAASQGPNTISASQARAARRREALSNEQAVSAWLRELSGRNR